MPKEWFVLRVQSNREDKVRDNLVERIRAQGMESLITNVLVPSEKISEVKGGKKRVSDRKIYPGYIMVEIEVDEKGQIPKEVWFTIRETSGTGEFIGGQSKPVPMTKYEVEKLLSDLDQKEERPRAKIEFNEGEKVRIKEGPFENYDGIVEEVLPASGRVKVMLTVFGRATPVELEYWQVESI
ncbi:transcription termination/antitermination protein NusG [Candidatus Kuenenia stuttgartiensis]|jgi:transcriptional antiterminator NusG|uniref:Transcription termination/antitermination protein NusG n=1 Tax=Kuenenia stuttgartiensis TaxID=174633 RepID=Q1Q133_KUEST|nr:MULTISPECIES: transcription termination/antitermination protein NusG [Kuenenia]MBE7547810.1 transcription termination/antitermination factor NusG [Planctomycetia bacterium]MBW7941058.1 transcription termination/antitermination factor NusG [Candidatus Kuenenia stuttgartiensis]MBZ0190167.1 transcription termination/antitermination protein NusG [Candidatus Kuenenia stuttgartiensis]MCF6152353.1 transcription termination/antitermination factor NusG [Candidatus Kuenenia stuttgartiensis]MCL4726150